MGYLKKIVKYRKIECKYCSESFRETAIKNHEMKCAITPRLCDGNVFLFLSLIDIIDCGTVHSNNENCVRDLSLSQDENEVLLPEHNSRLILVYTC